jgi:RNA polymerase sigma-70 factor (TIGR02960 family)
VDGILADMDDADFVSPSEEALVEAARRGDGGAFERLVSPYRGELHVHCYRMLGSVQDAEDALQDALLGAWRGLPGFAGRSSLRSWLYRIATNACLKLGGRRSNRLLPLDVFPARETTHDLGDPMSEVSWLEPYPETMLERTASAGDPGARYELRESVELAFVAALQHLPATQRAVLILREVLAFSATEVAEILDTTVPAVNSALQRARTRLEERVAGESQQATLRALGESRQRELAEAFVGAMERADVAAILDLLVEDARFTMPPLPAWFNGRDAIGRFMRERMFETPWRLISLSANGQLAFACYQGTPDGPPFRIGALTVLTLRGEKIAELTAFLDPAMYQLFGLAGELPVVR